MKRRRIVGTAVMCLLVVAGCNDSAKLTAPSTVSPQLGVDSNDNNEDAPANNRHPVKSDIRGALGAAKTAGSGIVYHGGPLLTAATKVAAIYWAASPVYAGGPAAGSKGAGSADGSLIGKFMRGLGGSPYFGINTTYYNASNVHVSNVVNYTQYWANNQYSVPSAGQNVSDATMIAMLQYGINNGYLTYDANTLYNIFTAGTVNLGGGFGTQYCAYHTHGTVTVGGVAKTILYSAMPYDYAYPSACSDGAASPNNDFGRGCRGQHARARDRRDHDRPDGQCLVRSPWLRERRQVRLDLRHHLQDGEWCDSQYEARWSRLPGTAELGQQRQWRLRPAPVDAAHCRSSRYARIEVRARVFRHKRPRNRAASFVPVPKNGQFLPMTGSPIGLILESGSLSGETWQGVAHHP